MRWKWGWVSSAVAVTLVASGAGGCGVRKTALPASCPDDGCPPEVASTFHFLDGYARDLDVLFVVDDTAALASRAEALAAGYRKAASILGPRPADPELAPSVHVAFVSGSHRSDTDPVFSPRAADCGIAPPGQVLATDKCGSTPNTTRSFEDTFACLAALGNVSTGAFEPFAALKRAFGGFGLVGFLRPNAYVQVVIVAGQDDASSVGITDLVAFLKGLKPYPNKVMLSVVGSPTADSDAGTSAPAARLLELVQTFGTGGLYVTESSDDALALALEHGYRATGRLDGSTCIPRVFDTDPSVAGLQPDCVVTARRLGVEGGYGEVEQVLPSCDHSAPPCWTLSPSEGCGHDPVLFQIDRGPDGCSQDGLFGRLTCRSCVGANDPACRTY